MTVSQKKWRKPSTVACPICGRRAERQPPKEASIDAYLCDVPNCVVSSFTIRWAVLSDVALGIVEQTAKINEETVLR
jgi:hypothetical protein